MRKAVIVILVLLSFVSVSFAESYLYLEQTKAVNSSFVYHLPKLEWNFYKNAGKFFNMPCLYISEIETSLDYTAPRNSMTSLNHHSIYGAWNIGVQTGAFWGTYGLNARYYILGNSDGIPEGFELSNSLRLGISF